MLAAVCLAAVNSQHTAYNVDTGSSPRNRRIWYNYYFVTVLKCHGNCHKYYIVTSHSARVCVHLNIAVLLHSCIQTASFVSGIHPTCIL